jgi:hypothetical protein
MTKSIEWRLEPNDGDDIIDPLFYERKLTAIADIPVVLRDFSDAKWVDVCRVERYGDADHGVTDEVYDYKARYYRDGRVVTLETPDGLSPEEVA